jgi:glycosyltransferase involved in cell wall biosynthesis
MLTNSENDSPKPNRPISLSVVVPVYNEENTVKEALTRLFNTLGNSELSYEIIVVESQSTDQTYNILTSLKKIHNFLLIRELSPSGKGSAVIKGIKESKGLYISIFDADLEYLASDLPNLVRPLINEKADFVLGTRHRKGESIRNFGKFSLQATALNFAHKVLTGCINSFYKSSLTDPFTMHKVFKKSIFLDTTFLCSGFDLDWELILRALRLNVRIIEIPVSYNARSFDEGKKIKFLRDGLAGIRALLMFRFMNLESNTLFGVNFRKGKSEFAIGE